MIGYIITVHYYIKDDTGYRRSALLHEYPEDWEFVSSDYIEKPLKDFLSFVKTNCHISYADKIHATAEVFYTLLRNEEENINAAISLLESKGYSVS